MGAICLFFIKIYILMTKILWKTPFQWSRILKVQTIEHYKSLIIPVKGI